MDIDWEYPKLGQSSRNFLSLLKELRTALNGKLLTGAVVAYGDENGLGVASDALGLLGFVNIIAYDGPDHGMMDQFNRANELLEDARPNWWEDCDGCAVL